jgi:hypothetical protein
MKKSAFLLVTTMFLTGLGLMLGAPFAHAVPIAYTINFGATGSLGSTNFVGQNVSITFIGNTANVTGSFPTFVNNVGTAQVSVGAGGAPPITATITDPVSAVNDCGCGEAGIGLGPKNVFVIDSGLFANYDLKSEIIANGILFGAGTFPQVAPNRVDLNTSLGALRITSPLQGEGSGTFRAQFIAVTTPEPASTTLLLLGISVLGLRARMRRKGN